MKVGDEKSFCFGWNYREMDSHLTEEVESSFLIASALQRPVFELHWRFAVLRGGVFVYNEHCHGSCDICIIGLNMVIIAMFA